MDARAEVRDFLTSRRARITPSEVGLTSYGVRHVPGLRREEVATLAGVSVDYYNRMERGSLAGVSDGVLNAIAGALRLDDAERQHLYDLARAASIPAAARRRGSSKRTVRPGVQWLLDSMTGAVALAVNSRQDILAANHLGRAFLEPLFGALGRNPAVLPNMARFTYLDPRAVDFFADWNRMARECVAALRTQAGRDPYDRELSDLVGELTTRSAEFAELWAAHDVRLHRNVRKQFCHPVVGDLDLQFDRITIDGEPGLELLVYVAEPGTTSAEALRLLADWSTTSV